MQRCFKSLAEKSNILANNSHDLKRLLYSMLLKCQRRPCQTSLPTNQIKKHKSTYYASRCCNILVLATWGLLEDITWGMSWASIWGVIWGHVWDMSGGSSGACLGQSKIPATVKFLMQSLVEFDRDICRITRVPQIPCMICGCYERYEDFAAVGFYRILLWTAHQLHIWAYIWKFFLWEYLVFNWSYLALDEWNPMWKV